MRTWGRQHANRRDVARETRRISSDFAANGGTVRRSACGIRARRGARSVQHATTTVVSTRVDELVLSTYAGCHSTNRNHDATSAPRPEPCRRGPAHICPGPASAPRGRKHGMTATNPNRRLLVVAIERLGAQTTPATGSSDRCGLTTPAPDPAASAPVHAHARPCEHTDTRTGAHLGEWCRARPAGRTESPEKTRRDIRRVLPQAARRGAQCPRRGARSR